MNGFELYERFCDLLFYKGMTKTEFCKLANIRLSALSNWGSRGTMPSADMVLTISRVLKVPSDYVLGITDTIENESTAKYSVEDLKLIREFNLLSKESQKELILMLAFLKEREKKNNDN